MSISAISGNGQITGVAPVTVAGQVQSVQAPAVTRVADQADFSQSASMFAKLAELRKTDPQHFKELCQGISDDLGAAAKASTDPERAQVLGDLSQKFASSAQTGELPDLRPGRRAGQGQGLSQAHGVAGIFNNACGIFSEVVNGMGNLLTGNFGKVLGL